MAITKVTRTLLSTGIDDQSNATAITIDSSENVGIGTTSPSTALHIYNTGARPVTIGNASATWSLGTSSTNFAIRENSSGSDYVTIDSSGHLLHGTSGTSWTDTAGTYLFYQSAVNVTRDGAESMNLNRLSSDGNIISFRKAGTEVGSIGTEGSRPYFIKSGAGGFSISSAGHIIPATSTGAVSDNTKDLGISTVRFKDLYLSGAAYSGGSFSAGTTGNSTFFAEGSQHIFRRGSAGSYAEFGRFDSSGRLLVGNTGLTNCKTSIYNSGVDALRIALSDNAASGTSFIACFSDSTTTAYGNLRFNVTANGNVTNSNNSYGAISDEKLKENIVDATDKLEDLKQVRIRNYNFIGEDKKQIGVIAQELETIFPNMVDETPDLDNDNNDLGTTTKSVKYSIFVPMLVKAIQEQQTIIDNLKTRIETLESA